MRKLPANFPILLKDIDKVLEFSEDMSYKNIMKVYKKINNILEQNNCEVYDLNKVIKEYNINNEYSDLLKKLKKFNTLKNSEIAKQAFKNKKWGDFIKKETIQNQHLFIDKLLAEDVEKNIIKVMKKYKNNWLGFWTIIKLSEN
ncbi:MAG: hypothetical protein CMF62_00915 [Magnetococcales bacterium]|nr:hypothetical protein [Magnetococcales bacterium]